MRLIYREKGECVWCVGRTEKDHCKHVDGSVRSNI